ncbi:MAG: ribonuclease III [Crocinitomicaceae bacterium]|nr:ribonuclease III [Crocinitomicaceae bacterium]
MGLLRNRSWGHRWARGSISSELRQFVRSEFGVRVRNGTWYKQAMTHGSMMSELQPGEQTNERLEFLGDSILGAVAAELVFFRYPNQDEGPLTQKRSNLVSRKSLNRIGEAMGLGAHIQTNITQRPLPSTVIGNALEALIGAIYLDHGYKKTRALASSMLVRYGAEEVMEASADFKSSLYHWAQVEGKVVRYEDKIVQGTHKQVQGVHEVVLVVDDRPVSEGSGSSKKEAEQEAARVALERGEWREKPL